MNFTKTAIGVLAALSLTLAGCGSEESPMTKNEEEILKNPPKEMSAAAREAMSKMGEGMARAAREREAQGVDSRGVPLERSQERGQAPGAPAPSGGDAAPKEGS